MGRPSRRCRFEVICLAETIRSGGYSKAYLVLGGEGWKLRQFYTSGGLAEHLRGASRVGKLRPVLHRAAPSPNT